MSKRIVIIGAGYSGILTAKKLAKKFKKNEEVSITIIDKNPFHTMLTELHEVAACRVDDDSIKIDLQKVFAKRKVDVKLDNITKVDFDNKKVIGNAASYDYDYLVVCAGSKPTYFGTPGAEEFSYKLWSYEDAVKLRDRIHEMFRLAASETDPLEREKYLSFHIVGAGFTGVEMAGELAEYVPILCEKYQIDREDVHIYNVDVLSRTVPNLPEKLSKKVEKRLTKMGVEVKLNSGVCSVSEDSVEIKSNDVCTFYPTKTVVWAAGVEGADITATVGESLTSAARARLQTDSYLRSVDNENVFVVGDNILYTAKGEERPVPQIVENAEHSASTAAHNIEVAIKGQGSMEEYNPSFHGFMVCIGGRYGVAKVGFPNKMINLPSFLAMFAKHFINIVYFIQVLGWNKIFSYMKHEFFTIRNCRSFVGGHFSNRTPSFLLVPLRVWLGMVWVFEGVKKAMEGWFEQPMLEGFFGGAKAWYDGILSGGGQATDAASAATEAAGEGAVDAGAQIGTVIFNFDFLGLVQPVFVSGKDLATSAIEDFAFKLNVPLMDWFTDSLLLPNEGFQIFMQSFIVVAEILIGLALIGGLFTTPASAFSLILQFMFVCTTGLYMNTFWMIFAAIALLIAGGRTFGFDYYAMPALKKGWKKIPFVKKWYLYND